jgi:hypothetical protein
MLYPNIVPHPIILLRCAHRAPTYVALLGTKGIRRRKSAWKRIKAGELRDAIVDVLDVAVEINVHI